MRPQRPESSRASSLPSCGLATSLRFILHQRLSRIVRRLTVWELIDHALPRLTRQIILAVRLVGDRQEGQRVRFELPRRQIRREYFRLADEGRAALSNETVALPPVHWRRTLGIVGIEPVARSR